MSYAGSFYSESQRGYSASPYESQSQIGSYSQSYSPSGINPISNHVPIATSHSHSHLQGNAKNFDERDYFTRTPDGRESVGYLSVTYGWDKHNLPLLHTTQTFTYQASQGRDQWLRTFGEDQEWLKRIAEGGVPQPKVETEWDRPWIGAIVVTTDPTVVILKDCIRDGPADFAHLDDDDKILGFGGASVSDTASFNRAFRDYAKVNETIQVTYLEEGRGSPKTTQLKVLSMGHKNELLEKHRRNGVDPTTDVRRR